MAGVYLSSPRSNSGGRYHSVITLLVYGRLEDKIKRVSKSVNNCKMEAKNKFEFTGVVCMKEERERFTSLQSYTDERDQSLRALFGP